MPISGPEILLYEKKNRIVTITLNRPERLNALSVELRDRLEEAWQRFRDEEDAWVAIVTGAGEKAFTVGMDLREQAEKDTVGAKDAMNTVATQRRAQWCPKNIWKPIIAAVNGLALAGGWCLAQNCDIRIAAEHAELGISETKWNQPAAWVHDLTWQIHLGHALEIALWGDKNITAQRGYEIGWINRVVPKEKLMDEAMSWAERMLYLGPRSVRVLKQTLYQGFYLEGRSFADVLAAQLQGMEDTIEGPRAFAERRKPVFKNK